MTRRPEEIDAGRWHEDMKIERGEGKTPHVEKFPFIPEKGEVRTEEAYERAAEANCHASLVSPHPVESMLDALAEALDADMEQGVLFAEAARAEFKRKYPRFTTLLAYARRIDWNTEMKEY